MMWARDAARQGMLEVHTGDMDTEVPVDTTAVDADQEQGGEEPDWGDGDEGMDGGSGFDED